MATYVDDGPPVPRAVLRGHKAQVHVACFILNNERLVTGDADGFVIVWDLTILRPTAVWQPHSDALLGLADWGSNQLITQGRDNRIIVWQFSTEDEARMSTILPIDPSPARPKPWMLHSLEVNTTNFCSFASCMTEPGAKSGSDLLLAVPNTIQDDAVDIFHIPAQKRLHTVRIGEKYGMIMALSLVWIQQTLTIVAGFENGIVAVVQLLKNHGWKMVYHSQSHTQPILSLDVAPDLSMFITSGADALLVKHPLPVGGDQVIELTESEDQAPNHDIHQKDGSSGMPSLLSAMLKGEAAPKMTSLKPVPGLVSNPLKIVNTKHSGQQSVRIRSDSRVFATAGWDAKARVYSFKTMKEVAVLKWHQTGCYALAFAEVDSHASESATTNQQANTIIRRDTDLTVKQRRIQYAKAAHWVAVGSKDGRVSLWDIF